jgi:hypothetical protein
MFLPTLATPSSLPDLGKEIAFYRPNRIFIAGQRSSGHIERIIQMVWP